MAESTENFTKSPTDSSIGANANSIGPIKTDSHKGPKHSSYHDQAYKMVFKRNSLFLEFLRLYTETDWLDSSIIKWVNLWNSDFEILDSGGIAADIIYEASEKEERVDLGFPTGSMAGIKTLPPDFSKYYLVLLEFQSRVDFTMPFRLLEYLIESERRIFLNTPVNIRERKGYRLPVIHPIVLFSDKQKMWTAEAQLRDFYENPGRFGDISPNFRYDVFNVNGISKAKLMEMEGALRLIFLLDQEIGNDLGELLERYLYVDQEAGKLGNDEKIVVVTWIKEVIRIKYFNGDKTRFDKFIGKGRNIMTFYQEYWPEAWQEGKKEGIAETEKEKAEFLAKVEREKAESLAEAEREKAESLAKAEREKAESLAEAEREKAEYGAYTHIRALKTFGIVDAKILETLKEDQKAVFYNYDFFESKYKDYNPPKIEVATA